MKVMVIELKDRKMCLQFDQIQNNSKWFGWKWTVVDENKLAELIARVALGQYRIVKKIINDSKGINKEISNNVYDKARSRLTASEFTQSNRDGWMFQIIAWIAAVYKNKNDLIRAPHIKWSEKGPDGLIIELHEKNVAKVIICEEKASENPKSIVKGQVWPEIVNYESNSQDGDLKHYVAQVLETEKSIEDDEIDDIISKILWERARAYRISLPIERNLDNDNFRKQIFENYENYVPGDISRRRVETLELTSLRSWMQCLASNAIGVIDRMEADSHV